MANTRDTDSSLYQGVTGKKPKSTAATRRDDIVAQMEGYASHADKIAAQQKAQRSK